MSDQPAYNPGYGSVETQGAPAPPPGGQAPYPTGGPAPYPTADPAQVQPAMPSEPPPQYEPPKSGPYAGQPQPQPSPYPPQQGAYPQQGPYPQQPVGGAYPPAPAGYPAYPQQGPPPQGGVMPPPGPGYQAVPVVTSQTQIVVASQVRYGQNPMTVQCPHCQQTVTTSLGTQTGMLTWLSAGLICLFGCWAGCCLIPFCIPDLQDVTHQCPNCHKHLGTYQRLS